MPRPTTRNTGNIFTITLTSNRHRQKHTNRRPQHRTIVILYFATATDNNKGTSTMLKVTLLLCCIIVGVIAKYPPQPPSTANNAEHKDRFYPLKTFFIRMRDVEANRMSHKLLQEGRYHDFLEVHQIPSRAYYGWNVILQVTTDDTHFLNSKTAVWPTRPEFQWISDAVNNDLSSIYYVHYATYTVAPN